MLKTLKTAVNALYDKTLYRILMEERLKKMTFSGLALDVGSRNRRYDALLSGCQRVVAVDLKPNSNKEVIACSATALAFKDQIFDVVICIEVIHYIENFQQALSEMKRVLKPGGILVITVPFLVRMCHDFDVFRLTAPYWQKVLDGSQFEVKVEKWGGRWGVAFDAIFDKTRQSTRWWKVIFAPFFYVLMFLARTLDRFEVSDPYYAMGYFITVQKLV